MSTSSDPSKGAWVSGFQDFAAGLMWPRLLESARLALRPARLGLSLVMLVLVGLIGQIPWLWLKDERVGWTKHWGGPLGLADDRASTALSQIAHGVVSLNHLEVWHGLGQLFIGMPRDVVVAYPWSSLAIAVPALLVWTVGGGAISRMAATEFSLDRGIGWTKGLAFAINKAWSLFFAVAAPLLVVGLIVGVLAIGGLALLGIPGVRAVGAVFFALALLGGAAAVIVFVAYLLGMPMLVPAVAAEGTDAIDAIQRTYAYVTGRPLRLILYWAVLIVEAAVVTLVLAVLAGWVIELTTWASSLLLGQPMRDALSDVAKGNTPNYDALSTGGPMAVRIVAFWLQVPLLLVASFVVSFWFSAGTTLYLLMRQVCDGQDVGELWTPGMVAGTHAPVEPGEGEEFDE
jgi:hypothetical protein